MVLIQKVPVGQIQGKVDDFAGRFADLVSDSEDFSQWATDNLTAANITAGLLVDDQGQPMTEAMRVELLARLNAIGGFAAWANTPIVSLGNRSPDKYLRGIRRTI